MSLRQTFGSVVEKTRNEARLSTNTSRGIDHLEHIQQIVKRNYTSLCEEYDSWTHLLLKHDSTVNANRKTLAAGSRYYDFPTLLNPLKIERVWVKWGGTWQPVAYGIDYSDYSDFDPAEDQRTDPVLRWQYYGSTQFEVWPIPLSNGTLDGNNEIGFDGQRLPEQIVDDTSRLDMDDILIALLSAAEILAENQSKAAEVKGRLAQRRLDTLRGSMGGKGRFALGQGQIDSGRNRLPRHPQFMRVS